MSENRDNGGPAVPVSDCAIDEYLGEYMIELDDGFYRPSENDKSMIKDAIIGFLSTIGATATSQEPAVPQGAIVNGRIHAERLEMEGFEDSHGHRMTMCSDWHELRRCFEHLAEFAQGGATPAPAPAPAPAVQQVEPNPADFTVELIVKPMGGFAPITTHGVRVTHKPTGLSVTCETERSQHRNKHIAFEKLRAMLATTSAHEKVPAQGSWVVFSNSIGIGVTAVGGSDVAWTRCERFGLHDDSRSRAEDEANARVMAAARDLLDAADMALNTLLGCCIAMGGVDDRKTMLEAQQKLRKAIRKANGGP